MTVEMILFLRHSADPAYRYALIRDYRLGPLGAVHYKDCPLITGRDEIPYLLTSAKVADLQRHRKTKRCGRCLPDIPETLTPRQLYFNRYGRLAPHVGTGTGWTRKRYRRPWDAA